MEQLTERTHLRPLPRHRDEPPPVVAELLRRLVEELDDASSGRHGTVTVDGQDILLDVRLDGYCYTLSRTADQVQRDGITLSPRETEIVRLVARGLPTKAIATVLDVSLWTVSTHLRRVFAKLQVSSRAEMVARALEEGLI